jgi:hypothetical protein
MLHSTQLEPFCVTVVAENVGRKMRPADVCRVSVDSQVKWPNLWWPTGLMIMLMMMNMQATSFQFVKCVAQIP